ncbi:hypothetical protein Tco_1549377 [Tanacetum coccineum]
MGAFIREFKITNELLLKERNNSLSELKFEVYELSKAINDAQLSNYKVKGVTTRGGKTTTKIIRDTNDINKEPLIHHHDKPEEPNEVLVEIKPQEMKEQTVKPPAPLIPFPYRLKKEKEESQQQKILENLKQLHINIPFTEAISQMPKYAKFLKGLLSNKTRSFLATARAMIDVFNKKITLRVGNEEVIFDVDQSIKRPPAEDDECYGIDYLDTTIHLKTEELLEDDQFDSFLVNNLEKSIDQSDLESFGKADDRYESKTPRRRIEQVNMPYSKS